MMYIVIIAWVILQIIVTKKLQTHYFLWKDRRFWQQYQKDKDIRLRQQRKIAVEKELHKIEKRKYPLFFLKGGIV